MGATDDLAIGALAEAQERAVARAGELVDEWMTRAEDGVYGALTAAKAEGPLTKARIDEALQALSAGVVAAIADGDLWILDKAIGFNRMFDFTACDPELLNENLNAAYIGQLRELLVSSLVEGLLVYVDEHPQLLVEPQAVEARSRLSPLAESPASPPSAPVSEHDIALP